MYENVRFYNFFSVFRCSLPTQLTDLFFKKISNTIKIKKHSDYCQGSYQSIEEQSHIRRKLISFLSHYYKKSIFKQITHTKSQENNSKIIEFYRSVLPYGKTLCVFLSALNIVMLCYLSLLNYNTLFIAVYCFILNNKLFLNLVAQILTRETIYSTKYCIMAEILLRTPGVRCQPQFFFSKSTFCRTK